MIPFQKIFTLCIRTFSKPMLALMKKKQQEGKLKTFRWLFVGLGRRYHIFQHWLNHKIIKTAHKKQLTELKEEILLQKGVEAFYEWFFYSIVIGLPMYQLYKSYDSAEKKQAKLKHKIESMEQKLDSANESLTTLIHHISQNKDMNTRLKEQRSKQMQELLFNRSQIRLANTFIEAPSTQPQETIPLNSGEIQPAPENPNATFQQKQADP